MPCRHSGAGRGCEHGTARRMRNEFVVDYNWLVLARFCITKEGV